MVDLIGKCPASNGVRFSTLLYFFFFFCSLENHSFASWFDLFFFDILWRDSRSTAYVCLFVYCTGVFQTYFFTGWSFVFFYVIFTWTKFNELDPFLSLQTGIFLQMISGKQYGIRKIRSLIGGEAACHATSPSTGWSAGSLAEIQQQTTSHFSSDFV